MIMRTSPSRFENLYIDDALFSDEHDMFGLGCWPWTHWRSEDPDTEGGKSQHSR